MAFPRRDFASELCENFVPRKQRAQGMPGAGRTHSPVWGKNSGPHEQNSPQVKPNERHSLRDGFTAYSVLSPGYRAC